MAKRSSTDSIKLALLITLVLLWPSLSAALTQVGSLAEWQSRVESTVAPGMAFREDFEGFTDDWILPSISTIEIPPHVNCTTPCAVGRISEVYRRTLNSTLDPAGTDLWNRVDQAPFQPGALMNTGHLAVFTNRGNTTVHLDFDGPALYGWGAFFAGTQNGEQAQLSFTLQDQNTGQLTIESFSPVDGFNGFLAETTAHQNILKVMLGSRTNIPGLGAGYAIDDIVGTFEAVAPVPEPGTGVLLLSGLLATAATRRRGARRRSRHEPA